MSLAEIEATLSQHKGPALAAAGGVVVLLALARRKRAAAAPVQQTSAPIMSGVTGYSAGAQSMGGAAYDSTSTDIVGALTPQLSSIGSQLSQLTNPAASPTPVPKPVASTLFAPLYTGKDVELADGTVAEIESDGSLFGMTHPQYWANPNASKDLAGIVNMKASPLPVYYTTAGNVATSNPAPAAK